VFVPVAIVVPRERLKGKAARKNEQAARYRAPIDDYDKPWRGGG